MATSVNPRFYKSTQTRKLFTDPEVLRTVLLDKRITPAARVLYYLLQDHLIERGRPNPTHYEIARLLGTSQRTVRTLVAELKRRGLLRVVQQGRNLPNRYDIQRPR